MSNETNTSLEQTKINWDALKPGASGEYLKLENDKPRIMSFKLNSMRTERTDFLDQKTKQPKEGMKLVLTLDSLDGKPSALTFDITSKRSAMQVKAFYENNLLYVQKFQVTKSGAGTDITYSWINLGSK